MIAYFLRMDVKPFSYDWQYSIYSVNFNELEPYCNYLTVMQLDTDDNGVYLEWYGEWFCYSGRKPYRTKALEVLEKYNPHFDVTDSDNDIEVVDMEMLAVFEIS